MEVPEDDPQAEKPLHGPNLWPTAGNFATQLLLHVEHQSCFINLANLLVKSGIFFFCKDILPGWRETMERYHREAL